MDIIEFMGNWPAPAGMAAIVPEASSAPRRGRVGFYLVGIVAALTACSTAVGPPNVTTTSGATSPVTTRTTTPTRTVTPRPPSSSRSSVGVTTTAQKSDSAWLLRAESACESAITTYATAKRKIGNKPELLTLSAGQAANGILLGLPTPPTPATAALRNGLREYAAALQGTLRAMEDGRASEVNQAYDVLDAAGEALKSAARRVGATLCADVADRL